MTLSDASIRRPILTWMMMLSLLVFGVLGYVNMGVDAYPAMEFPVVMVTARLEGASPEVMEEDVTDVLEENLNTIAGVRQLSSTSSQGTSVIVVEFDLDRDLDSAAQDVRDKVALARVTLPKDVEPPVVDKVNPADQPILWIPIQTDRTIVDTSEFVRLQLKPELETIPGVGSVVMFGRRDRNMRIWLDGEALRARGLAASDVIAAIGREHLEVPGGQVISQRVEYSVKTDAEFRSREALENLVVTERDGAQVLLRDVARVEDGSEDVRTLARYNGQNTVGLGLRKQPGANTVAIADEAYRRIDKLRPILPSGLTIGEREGLIDFSTAIRESVNETLFALAFGALLATLTVWLFLRRWRPTLIVGLAIPLSIVATFGVMWSLGYTLNIMTLLALTLAVGVVVDDAIVVLENIERHRASGEPSIDAATNATREIAFAATAATLSIAAVFLPVVFVTGIVGNFLREFGLTTASARADLALRGADAHAHAGRAHPAGGAGQPGERLPPPRADVPRPRVRLPAPARLDAAASHGHARHRRALAAGRRRLRHAAPCRVLPAGRPGPLPRLPRDAGRHDLRVDARAAEAGRAVDPGAAGGGGPLRRRRHPGPARARHRERRHPVRDAEAAPRARAFGAGPDPRGPRGAGPDPGPADHGLRLLHALHGARARRLRVLDPRQPGARPARPAVGRVHPAPHSRRGLRRPRQEPQARPARAAGGARPREGRSAGRGRPLPRHRRPGHDRRPRRRNLQGRRPPLRHPRAAR